MVWADSSRSLVSMAAGAMVRSTSSPWPLTRAVTRPPPAVPATSASASSCWAFISCSCICCAAASSCCMSSWPSGFTSPPVGVVSVNWRAYDLSRTLSTARAGLFAHSPLPVPGPAQSPGPPGRHPFRGEYAFTPESIGANAHSPESSCLVGPAGSGGSVLDLADDLATQLALDQVHPGDLGLPRRGHVFGIGDVQLLGPGVTVTAAPAAPAAPVGPIGPAASARPVGPTSPLPPRRPLSPGGPGRVVGRLRGRTALAAGWPGGRGWPGRGSGVTWGRPGRGGVIFGPGIVGPR